MGRMKDQLIDAPCHWCGVQGMLTPSETTEGWNSILLCDLCRCTNDSCEEGDNE